MTSIAKYILLISSLFSAFSLSARDVSGRYGVSLMGMYGWNETWKGYGGVDVMGYMPFHKYFEATAAAEVHSPAVVSFSATARPKYQLSVGELFADGSFYYRHLSSYDVADIDFAVSAGYRMDYVSAQLGVVSHVTCDLEHSGGSGSDSVRDPVSLLYRFAFNVRPASSCWNAGAGVANYTDFEYENTLGPLFFLHGRYDIGDRISVILRGELKPAGVFHMNAQFWGISFRLGASYSF